MRLPLPNCMVDINIIYCLKVLWIVLNHIFTLVKIYEQIAIWMLNPLIINSTRNTCVCVLFSYDHYYFCLYSQKLTSSYLSMSQYCLRHSWRIVIWCQSQWSHYTHHLTAGLLQDHSFSTQLCYQCHWQLRLVQLYPAVYIQALYVVFAPLWQ